jgi:hypothetical protein
MEAIFQEIVGKLAFYYVALIMPRMQTPPFGWSYVMELLHTSYACWPTMATLSTKQTNYVHGKMDKLYM